jgi:RTX calcium-binding nonapeptide repeat (4 copies)
VSPSTPTGLRADPPAQRPDLRPGGRDVVSGSPGNDRIFGGGGDRLFGGADRDRLFGGAGTTLPSRLGAETFCEARPGTTR